MLLPSGTSRPTNRRWRGRRRSGGIRVRSSPTTRACPAARRGSTPRRSTSLARRGRCRRSCRLLDQPISTQRLRLDTGADPRRCGPRRPRRNRAARRRSGATSRGASPCRSACSRHQLSSLLSTAAAAWARDTCPASRPQAAQEEEKRARILLDGAVDVRRPCRILARLIAYFVDDIQRERAAITCRQEVAPVNDRGGPANLAAKIVCAWPFLR